MRTFGVNDVITSICEDQISRGSFDFGDRFCSFDYRGFSFDYRSFFFDYRGFLCNFDVAITLHPRCELLRVNMIRQQTFNVIVLANVNDVITSWTDIRHHHHGWSRATFTRIIRILNLAQTFDVDTESINLLRGESFTS